MLNYHRERFRKLTFRALALRLTKKHKHLEVQGSELRTKGNLLL